MLIRTLKVLIFVALAAPPLTILSGCEFNPPSPGTPNAKAWNPGELGRTTVIFCDIERDRDCASIDEQEIAIKDPMQDGFLMRRSGQFGLDTSQQAMAACGGPKKIVFQGQYPNGSPVCVNPDRFGPGSDQYANAEEACKAWCDSHAWIDDDGNRYKCENIAWASTAAGDAATNPAFQNGCTPAGTYRSDFDDPRIP